jgi:NAD(P)-dependent dehydrogenase (short-subunit alcohol dehydrogenase family)
MPQPTELLKDKVAVVTGGGGGGDGGIGRGICEAFASHGARVAVVDHHIDLARQTVALIEQAGGQAVAVAADVEERAQVASMVEQVVTKWSRIDVLVNNVGDTLRIRKDFLETDEAEWAALYGVNLKHVLLCIRAVGPLMVKSGSGGSIINVSTVEAFRGIPHMAVYSAFKAGITEFTKSFALEVGRHDIRVNAIAPDMVNWRQTDEDHSVPPEQRHLIPVWVPRGRLGLPRDVAGAAVYLASDLSDYVTGTTLHVDGGTLAAGGWYRTGAGGWTNRPTNP